MDLIIRGVCRAEPPLLVGRPVSGATTAGIAAETFLCDEPPLSLDAKETLYRIAQESTHNVVKHARAGRIEVRLVIGNDQVLLDVADDGRGFDPASAFPGHPGHVSMRERVERLGGRLMIESAPGRGTSIRVRIPRTVDGARL